MPGFGDLLKRVSQYFHNHLAEVRKQSKQLALVLEQLSSTGPSAGINLDRSPLAAARLALEDEFDSRFGGFGSAPKFARAGSIALFIAFIGLADTGIIVTKSGTMVGLGDLTAPTAALSTLGLLVIAALQTKGVKGAMLLGILLTAAIAWILKIAHFAPGAYRRADLSATALKLDIPAALNLKGGVGLSLLEIVFVFLFVDMFDNVGTLMAVTKRAGLVAQDGSIPRLNRILLADSISMLVDATVGTSPVTS